MMTRSDRVARILCTVLRVCTISDFTAIRGFIIRPVIEMLLNVNESEYVLNNIYIYLGGLRIYRIEDYMRDHGRAALSAYLG